MSNKSKVYLEWLKIICGYKKTLNQPIIIHEIVLPMVISLIYSVIYYINNTAGKALEQFSDILPNVLSILIGFTLTILMILPGESSNIFKYVKQNKDDKVSPYKQLLIQFTFNVIVEVLLLALVFIYLSLKGLIFMMNNTIIIIFFFLELFLFLHIIFSTIRGVTNMFLSFSSYENE